MISAQNAVFLHDTNEIHRDDAGEEESLVSKNLEKLPFPWSWLILSSAMQPLQEAIPRSVA
jgi:hypothetical protein